MPEFEYASHRLYYRHEGSGAPLLLLPGNTSSSAHLVSELHYFAPHYYTVALDFLGTGQSGRTSPWSADWFGDAANQALALIEHLDRGPAIVIGTSGGAIAALLMAIRRPELVHAVVADSCVETYSTAWVENMLALREKATPEQVTFWQLGHGKDWKKVVDADSDMLRRFAEAGGNPFEGRLREIRCPVLFTAALGDEFLPDVMLQVRRMGRQIPGSRALFFASGGHPAMWSRASDFRRAVTRFLIELESQPRSGSMRQKT